MQQTDRPAPESKIGSGSEMNTAQEPDAASHEYDSDALRLISYAADALRDEGKDSPAFQIDRGRFNDAGTPEMLHIGRNDHGQIVWEVWSGRSEMKTQIRPQSTKLYKRLRRILMSYRMGEEIPVFSVGDGGHVGIALVTLEERPQIKSP